MCYPRLYLLFRNGGPEINWCECRLEVRCRFWGMCRREWMTLTARTHGCHGEIRRQYNFAFKVPLMLVAYWGLKVVKGNVGCGEQNRNCYLGGDGNCSWTQSCVPLGIIPVLENGTPDSFFVPFFRELELDKMFSSSSMGVYSFFFPKPRNHLKIIGVR